MIEHSCRTLSRDTLWDTLVGTLTLLWGTFAFSKVTRQVQNERLGVSYKTKSPQRALCTRFLPKVTRQVCKTNISHEICFKTHTSSLQHERFARDFLQKSCDKISSETTHSNKQFCNPSPSKSQPPTRESQPDSDIHLHQKNHHNLTLTCACHEEWRHDIFMSSAIFAPHHTAGMISTRSEQPF